MLIQTSIAIILAALVSGVCAACQCSCDGLDVSMTLRGPCSSEACAIRFGACSTGWIASDPTPRLMGAILSAILLFLFLLGLCFCIRWIQRRQFERLARESAMAEMYPMHHDSLPVYQNEQGGFAPGGVPNAPWPQTPSGPYYQQPHVGIDAPAPYSQGAPYPQGAPQPQGPNYNYVYPEDHLSAPPPAYMREEGKP
ncbi:hypothetical protein DFJ77DRAFT_547946 [Powellomyces hirtus]|nr:hypothetical protein DFJ77DRAFT_547946 [Powellomyces hirtus]